MRGAVLYGPRDVRFEERDAPTIIEPTPRDGRAPRDQDALAPLDQLTVPGGLGDLRHPDVDLVRRGR